MNTTSSSSAYLEQPAAQPATEDVVRVTAADVLPATQLAPTTPQTFDELEIPPAFRCCIEKELAGDEKLLWVGRPSRNPQVHPRNPMLLILGGGLLVLAVGVFFASLLSGRFIGCVFGVVLGVIGLVCLLPWLINTAKACRFCYAVTNRRTMLLELSVYQGPVAQSYLPHQLLGLERRDHAAVAGAGDLVFEYVFTLPGKSLNPLTGTFLQQGASAARTNAPQRVPRGFLCLDQVRAVEDLIRTTLLSQLEQAVVAPAPIAPNDTVTTCREDGAIPPDLKAKTLTGLDANEAPVWIGQPDARLVLARNGVFLGVGAVGLLAALVWLVVALMPAKAAVPRPAAKKPAALAKQGEPNAWLPVALLFASAGVGAVALVRWHCARRTCYVLTNRRALVYKEGLFGPAQDSYPPLEVAAMRRSDATLVAGSGDLIFRTVQVVSSQSRSALFSSRVKTIHFGFLAIPHLAEVEKLVRATLIDRFVDKLKQASDL